MAGSEEYRGACLIFSVWHVKALRAFLHPILVAALKENSGELKTTVISKEQSVPGSLTRRQSLMDFIIYSTVQLFIPPWTTVNVSPVGAAHLLTLSSAMWIPPIILSSISSIRNYDNYNFHILQSQPGLKLYLLLWVNFYISSHTVQVAGIKKIF